MAGIQAVERLIIILIVEKLKPYPETRSVFISLTKVIERIFFQGKGEWDMGREKFLP